MLALSTGKPIDIELIRNLGAFQTRGIVSELTGGKKNRVFAYKGYIDVLNQGTELGPPDRRPSAQPSERNRFVPS